MKRRLLEKKISKIYILGSILIGFLLLASYFSYAMFTVTKEKNNAISIVTGNLTYELLIDGVESNSLTVAANSRQDFIVTLNNPNTRIARFNFYYLGDLLDGVDIGYIEKESYNTPPVETVINLEQVSTIGSSNTYIVRLANATSSSVTINLGVQVGLDYNDLNLPSDGHLLRKITSTGIVSEVIEDDIMNRLNYEDSEQTFITGDNPYNYIWYSGKLWRAVSIDTSDNSTKLVTQYRLEGDNDTNLEGILLNTRYSGEYIRFGTGENNLYRIVNHETSGLTKITSAEPLKNNDSFISSGFGNNSTFSSTNIIGTFLNNDYLNLENGYLTSNDIAMIKDETTWYIGTVDSNESYKLAKYTNTTDNILTSSVATAKVGLLRLGELMYGQFNRYAIGDVSVRSNTYFWSLTRVNNSFAWLSTSSGYYGYGYAPQTAQGIKPSLNLKFNVIITGGDGTLQNPFTLALA